MGQPGRDVPRSILALRAVLDTHPRAGTQSTGFNRYEGPKFGCGAEVAGSVRTKAVVGQG